MNKIIFKNNIIETSEVDSNLKITTKECLVSSIQIEFLDSTELLIYYDTTEEVKLDIRFIFNKNINVKIYEFRKGLKTKVQYNYDLDEYAKAYLYRINNSINMRELDLISLNGENSGIEFNLRSLSSNPEKYDIYVSHNNKYTASVLNNIGIALRGSIIFNVTGSVPKGSSGSFLDQNNQIITFDSEKCQINPNLLIEEYDVDATHNAQIGKFDEETLFYLMSRGIDKKTSIKLLSQGLILNNLKENFDKEEILNYLKEYWGE